MYEYNRDGLAHAQLDRFAESVQYVGMNNSEHCTVTYNKITDSSWCIKIHNNMSNVMLTLVAEFDDECNVIAMTANAMNQDGYDIDLFEFANKNTSLMHYADVVNSFFINGLFTKENA